MKKRIAVAGAAALAVVLAVALAVQLVPGSVPAAQAALVKAEYPSMAPYPVEADYYDEASGELDYDRYSEDRDAWRKSRTALYSDLDGSALVPFLTASAKELLAEDGGKNKVYSPLNLYMALSMLTQTTGGESRQQLLDLLGAASAEELRQQAPALWKNHYRDDGLVTSVLGNSLWLRDDMGYSQETLELLAKDYYASSFRGKMGAAEYDQALRDWLNEQTHGLLAEQANGLEMAPETVLALASTLYFKAPWADEFQAERTAPRTFHTPAGDVETDFMHRSMSGSYYWGDHFSAVELRFQEGGSMWFLLPDEGVTPAELAASGEAMDFLLFSKQGRYDQERGEYVDQWPGQKYLIINVALPKFDVSVDLDLSATLQSMGVTDIFDTAAADFTPLGAETDDPLYVSRAQHAARVTVDEEGCEAAAYTVIMVECGAEMPPEEEVDFVLDRPFLFAVTSDDNLPLFLGTVNRP